MLVIWSERYAYGSSADEVTVKFDKTYESIKVYNPAQYNPAQPEKGTQPVRTETNANQLTLSMLNHPYILELYTEGAVEVPELEYTMFAPQANATKVPTNATISVTFNQAITLDEDAIVRVKNKATNAAVGNIALSITGDGKVLTIDHALLKYDSEYVVTVSEGTIVGYDKAIIWSFTTEEKEPANVNNPSKADFNIYSEKGKLVVKSENPDARFQVSTITGQSIADGTLVTGCYVMDLPAGVYVVKTADAAQKVIIQ